jgi:16S rRNA (guanine966-N2)-methyltransferase
MLASRLGTFEDLRVADLFAGSGALGFEALSRGAASVTFIEQDPNAASTIRRNAEKLGALDQARIIRGSALDLRRGEAFDLVFADPPYRTNCGSAVVAAVTEADLLARGGWLSLETGRGEEVEVGELTIEAVREAGKARLILLYRR